MSKSKAEEFLKERDDLFHNPTFEAAQAYCKKYDLPPPIDDTVPLAMVHKARLQWLDATDEMLSESMAWLKAHDYQPTLKDAPPLTPERRDSDRVSLGKRPLGEKNGTKGT